MAIQPVTQVVSIVQELGPECILAWGNVTTYLVSGMELSKGQVQNGLGGVGKSQAFKKFSEAGVEDFYDSV